MACFCFITAPTRLASVSRGALTSCRTTVRAPQPARRQAARAVVRMGLEALPLAEATSVNIPSLGATAFVFLLTFWGGISFVKGSTKERLTQASFTLREPPSAVAQKTSRYLMERSFVPDINKDGRKGVVTFTGKVRASSSVASILVAVGASGIWSLTYILNFLLPDALKSDWWGLLSFGALAVVPWYWKNAEREEEVKVLVEEEEGLSTLFVKAHRDEIIEMERAFNWKRNEEEEEDAKVAATPKSVK